MKHDRHARRVRDAIVSLSAAGSALAIVAVAGALLWDVWAGGARELSWSFLVSAPSDAGRGGGIAPMLVATLAIVGVCLAASLPLALGTALVLVEAAPTRLARWVARSLDVLASVPSIVFGLFGSALFCDLMGLGFSILSGGLTLACMILPVLIRSAEIGLRSVAASQYQAAAALALGRSTTLTAIVLPAAAPALIAGVVLGLGRAVAETAALIFTSGYVDRMPTSLFDSGRALSVHVYDLAMNVPGGESRAYASALVLLVVTVLANQVTYALLTRLERGRGR